MLKKRIIFNMALIMVLLTFGACDSKEPKDEEVSIGIVDETGQDQGDNTDDEEVSIGVVDEVTSEDDNTEDGASAEDEEITTGQESAQALSDIVTQIYELKSPGIKTFDNPLDLSNADAVKYNTGLKDSSKVKEAIVSEAMIISQAYSMILVRVNDAKDTESVANEMLEGIDPAKWICVTGDDLQIVTMDDLVLLIMVSSQLSDTVTSQEIVDAFAKVAGKEFGITLTK